MKSTLTSTAAGVAVAIIGLLPLLWVLRLSHTEPPPDLAVPVFTTVATAQTTTTTTVPEPTIVTIEPTTPELEGIGDAATRVLYANGYARYTAPDDLGDALPPSEVRLLIDRGVTLTVAVDAGEDGTP